jgi:hypothetical protein
MFLEFAGIIYRNYCMREEMYADILHRKNVVTRNAPKNGGPTPGFSFMIMLQHTSQFWSRLSMQRM